ncbi:MAG: carboxypeptidase-like regulatory domain-containing protein, partial [Bacteroidota bacterium]
LSSSVFAQHLITIRGTVTNDQAPIPGASIYVKEDPSIGTITDVNGRYELIVPKGATIMVSAIGMNLYEFITVGVTSAYETVLYKNTQYLDTVPDSIKDRKGVAILTKKTPSYDTQQGSNKSRNTINFYNLYKLRQKKDGTVVSSPYDTYYGGKRLSVSLNSKVAFEQINALPDRQSLYAQGRPQDDVAIWQGAETNEVFSWGPLVQTLQFDGNNYPYDPNGRLVPADGAGLPANLYDPTRFFQTGILQRHHFMVSNGDYEKYWSAIGSYQRHLDIIPNNTQEQYQLQLKGGLRTGTVRHTLMTFYNTEETFLPINGASHQSLVSGVLRTPPTFDNQLGLSQEEAIERAQSDLFFNGLQKSHASASSDNPFWLVATTPDKNRQRQWGATWQADTYLYLITNLQLNTNLSYNQTNQQQVFGQLPTSVGSEQGRFTERDFLAQEANGQVKVSHKIIDNYRKEISAHLQYDIGWRQTTLNRLDANGLSTSFDWVNADTVTFLEENPQRTWHQLKLLGNFQFFRLLEGKVANQIYLSNTLRENAFFLPTTSLTFDLQTFLDDYIYLDIRDVFTRLKIEATYARTLQEAPLIYNDWAYNSTHFSIENYLAYFEQQELFQHQQPVEAQRSDHWQLQLRGGRYQRYSFEIAYSETSQQEAIYPLLIGNQFQLVNVANIRNRAWNIHAQILLENSSVKWTSGLHFHRYRPVVTKLHTNTSLVPLAGYQEVGIALVENQSTGSIYGTRYQRNAQGAIIIGEEGFPLVAPTPTVVGDANPRWLLRWENNLTLHRWRFGMTWEYKHRGDVWNGTAAALDYWGVSQKTGTQRTIEGYVFEGVQEDGSPNTLAVDFVDNTQDVNQNRWTRYGLAGVTEAYVEDASWFRLTVIRLGYDFGQLFERTELRSNLTVHLYVRNLLLFTPYTGVDPMTSLMSYTQGTGLDFFNQPATRTLGIDIKVKL